MPESIFTEPSSTAHAANRGYPHGGSKKARIALYGLIAVVAAAAAVLSFAALRDLALDCGFAEPLAWLLPVTIDAGAAAGSIVWLARDAGSARAFGRALALALLGSSIAGNALGHALDAFATRPHWSVVVAVSAVAPVVLGACVHLVGLVSRPDEAVAPAEVECRAPDDPRSELLDDHGVSRLWHDAPVAALPASVDRSPVPDSDLPPLIEATLRKAEQAGEPRPGRRKLAELLGTTEHAIRVAMADVEMAEANR